MAIYRKKLPEVPDNPTTEWWDKWAADGPARRLKEGFGRTRPHQDPKIIHHPGSHCPECDVFPEMQTMRHMWGINFTDENDPNKVTVPWTNAKGLSSGVFSWSNFVADDSLKIQVYGDPGVGKTYAANFVTGPPAHVGDTIKFNVFEGDWTSSLYTEGEWASGGVKVEGITPVQRRQAQLALKRMALELTDDDE